MQSMLKRISVWPLLAAAIMVVAAGISVVWTSPAWSQTKKLVASESGQRSFAPRTSTPAPHPATQRLREGTALVDVPGHFKLTGDRATFFPTGSDAHYTGLENLNLERIATAISDIPEQIPWLVSGTVTEYRGTNYLLVTKAILQNAPAASGRSVSSNEPANATTLGQNF
jgi:hypothetical protein